MEEQGDQEQGKEGNSDSPAEPRSPWHRSLLARGILRRWELLHLYHVEILISSRDKTYNLLHECLGWGRFPSSQACHRTAPQRFPEQAALLLLVTAAYDSTSRG